MDSDLRKRVEHALDSIRPYLEADGGNVELLDITHDNKVMLQWKGACKSCSMSEMTLKAGIEEAIKREVPEINEVMAVNS